MALDGWQGTVSTGEMAGGNSRCVALSVGVVVAVAIVILGIVPLVVVPLLAAMAVGAALMCVGLHAVRPVRMRRMLGWGLVG